MPSFICDYLDEIVLLSDGNVTTCCLDPLGVNSFGNIYKHEFHQIQKKYIEIRNQITKDVLSMPRCSICYDKIKEAGFPPTGTYKVDPTSDEINLFIDKGRRL